MKLLKLLNKNFFFILLTYLIFFNSVIAEDNPVDIWNLEKKENEIRDLKLQLKTARASKATKNRAFDPRVSPAFSSKAQDSIDGLLALQYT